MSRMGNLIQRVRRSLRIETTARLSADSDSDKTQPVTFTSDLVTGEFTNKEDKHHRQKVTWEDPTAYKCNVSISHNVLDDWFILRENIGDKEPHPQNEKIQAELTILNAKFWVTQGLISERSHGWGAIYTGTNKYRADFKYGGQVGGIDVFTPIESEFVYIISEENKLVQASGGAVEPLSDPTHLRVKWNAHNQSEFDDVPMEDIIWMCTRPRGRGWDGYPANYAAWDDMTYLRSSKHALNFAHNKYGLGMFMWPLIGALTQEILEDTEDAIQNSGVMRATIVEKQKFDMPEFVGPPSSGTTNITEGIDTYLGQIAAATDIPKAIYTGTEAGAISGSEINSEQLFATISKIQSDIEPYIRELIRRMGFDIEYVIEWNVRAAVDKLKEAQTRMMNAQAAQIEMNVEQGINPNDISVRFPESPKDPEKDNNPTGVQAK